MSKPNSPLVVLGFAALINSGDTGAIIDATTPGAAGHIELAGPDGMPPSDDELQGPGIWSGRVQGELISEWRAFEDTPEVRESLRIQ